MMIYLDNAATSFPRPEAVCAEMDRVNRTLSVNAGRGGYKAAREASEIIYDTKKKLAELFHCTGKADVVLTPSVTQAFNQVLNGLDISENTVVYITAYEHNAIARTMESIRQRTGCTVCIIPMEEKTLEIDLKKTKDGHLVLMHDKTINRTMTGTGSPDEYTLAELKAMRLRNGAGIKTRHQIPTFEEVMNLCKGKIMVNVDKGYDYFKDAYEVLKKTGTVDQCIMKASLPYERVKAENGEVLDKMIFMPASVLRQGHGPCPPHSFAPARPAPRSRGPVP